MNPDLLTRLRKELATDRAQTVEELESMGAEPDSERIDPLDGIDDNFADSASATTERGEIFAQIGQARERLAGIDLALTRMDAGTYGRCEVCDTEIAEERLDARPLSVRCVDCAE